MLIKPVNLLGAAVHTRGIEPGQDYDWYVTAGDMQLFKNMTEIYRLMLRDVSGDVPRLAVIIIGQRIGFLMADMPSQRLDHGKRVIYDSLYLEFATQEQQTVLQAVAVLLLGFPNTYPAHEQHFMEYAEKLWNNSQTTPLIFTTVKLPGLNILPPLDFPLLTLEKVVLFSDAVNQKRCAHHLICLASGDNNYFFLISTGRVNLEKCQQLADKTNKCVLLTLSEGMEGTEMNLKKGRFFRWKQIFK